jgi:arylsulfatase A-like enzyme
MTLGLWRPHTPFTAPQRFFDMYDPSEIEIPEGYLENDLDDVPDIAIGLLDAFGRFEVTGLNNIERWKHFIHGYYACTSFADWNTGRLIEALEKSDYSENTIVMIFSDNGFHIGTKDHWEKNTLWDSSAEVPLIIRLPWSPLIGRTVDVPVGLIDLFPTLVELCKLTPPLQNLDGQSLLPFFENEGYSREDPVLTSLGENMISIRSNKYRYIQYPDGESELYDTETDPYEWTNLAGRKETEEIVTEHQKHIPGSFMKELPGIRRN